MNCREIQEQLAESGKADDPRVKEHLEKCSKCRKVLAGLEAVDTALRELPGVTPPKNVVQHTLAAVDRRKAKPRSSLRLALAIGSPVVLVLVVGIFGVILMKSGMEQARSPVGTADIPPHLVEMTDVGYTHSGRAYWVGDRTEATRDGFQTFKTRNGRYTTTDSTPAFKVEDLKDRVSITKSRLALLKEPTMGPEAAGKKPEVKKNQPPVSSNTVTDEIDKLDSDARDLQRQLSVRDPAGFQEELDLGKDIGQLEQAGERLKNQRGWSGEDDLPPGDHRVTLGREGYKPVEKRVKIQSGKTARIKTALEGEDLDQLAFIPARGYFKNTYLPGDPELAYLEEKLQKGLFMDGETLRLERAALPYRQPFDAPASSGLAVYLNADRAFVEGQSRVTLQVGLKGSERHARRRASLNAALVVDLRSIPSEQDRRALWALCDSMAQSLQAGDRFALVAVGVEKPLRVKPSRFNLTTVRVALASALEEIEASGVKGTLLDALKIAYQAVGGEGIDDAPIGANLVLLASAARIPGSTDDLQLDVHLKAVSGITLSTVGVGERADVRSLAALALAGQGRRWLVSGVNAVRPVVEEELSASGSVVARAVRLRIRLAKGVKLVEVLGSHPLSVERSERVREMERAIDKKVSANLGIAADRGDDEDGIQIVIPAYYAGDDHVILLDVVAPGPGKIADVRVRYKDLVNLKNAVARAELTLKAGQRPEDLLVRNVRKNLLAHRVSEELSQAAESLEAGRFAAARDTLAGVAARIEQMQARYPELADDPEIARDAGMLAEYLQVLRDYPVWQGNRDVQVHLVRSLAYAAKVKLPPGQPR